MQILLVDDDSFTLKILSGMLSQMGCSVVIARNGPEALARLRQGDIHLIISDWDMPGMDGLELCRVIRRLDLPDYVYLIILSAYEGKDSHLQALEAGADDFLRKPIKANELLLRFKASDRILKAINLAKRGQHSDSGAAGTPAGTEQAVTEAGQGLHDESKTAEPAEPKSSARILVVEDSGIMRNRILQLLSPIGATVYSAADSAQAMTLFTQHAPQVIISDLEMPGQDGLDFCRQIRQHATRSNTYFIMLTTHSEQSALLESYKAGVNDFVCKPFNSKELLARVNAGIRTTQLQEAMEEKTKDLQAMNANLAAMNGQLDRLAITDELTGLFNRRYAMQRLEEQSALADRYDRPLTVAIIDIDHFKHVNDTYGHDSGDVILRNVAGVIREQLHNTDILCRVGGEEFLVLFPAQSIDEAEICVERCRKAVAGRKHRLRDVEIQVTISTGLSGRTRAVTQLPDILKAADDALYAAKADGRNCVRKSTTSPEPAKPATLIDLVAIRKRCGGDEQFAAAVIEHFRADARSEVNRIAESRKSNDLDALRRAAHNLKSMAAYVSANEVSELSRKIEFCARTNNLSELEQLTNKLGREMEKAVQWIEQNVGPAVAA